MAKNKFYITTAIPYINAKPHIGHAMEFIEADVIARYRRLMGDDVWFLTGTDDNSLKNVKAAEEKGISVSDLVNRNAKLFLNLTQSLNISNDDFIRTIEKRHFNGVQKIWKACEKDIYKKKYKGLYCVGCEEFKKENELIFEEKKEGKKIGYGCCPEHPEDKLEVVEEENYFFKLSRYQDKLEKIIKNDEYKIIPETRKNEVLSFIRQGLEDFSISRSKERAHGWGIPVPEDKNQVIYVWFDALTNYITALNYASDQRLFKKYWPADTHLIGKGILKFHAVYWPAMLLSAGIELPKQLSVHGYITVGGQKMSKSLGNVIDPQDLVKKYGTDPVRYFLLREFPFGQDGDFSLKRFEERYNSDLANDLGNLTQRVVTMISKYLKGKLPAFYIKKIEKRDLSSSISQISKISTLIENLKFDEALASIWFLVSCANQLIDYKKPFALENKKEVEKILSDLVNYLLDIAFFLEPFMPETSKKITKIFSAPKIKPQKPLFPRIYHG